MFILAYIIEGLAAVIDLGLTVLYWLLFIRVIISWVNPDPYNQLVQFLSRSTEPILEPVRKILMPLTYLIRLDISPLVVFLLIVFLRKSLVGILIHLAYIFK